MPTHLYTCRSKCLAQEQNTMSPARAWAKQLNAETRVLATKYTLNKKGISVNTVIKRQCWQVVLYNYSNMKKKT